MWSSLTQSQVREGAQLADAHSKEYALSLAKSLCTVALHQQAARRASHGMMYFNGCTLSSSDINNYRIWSKQAYFFHRKWQNFDLLELDCRILLQGYDNSDSMIAF